jgi:hypothetical protein
MRVNAYGVATSAMAGCSMSNACPIFAIRKAESAVKLSAMRRQSTADTPRTSRSKVTNGNALFVVGKGTSPYARRFADILGAVVSDLGGSDQLSEGQRQLARRAASLSLACERLEAVICGGTSSAVEVAFTEASGGLSPYAILAETGRVLYGIARVRGGDGVRAMAELPNDELDRIVDLLTKAGDLAAKCIAAGSEKTADLELLGTLADRCGRTFMRLGLKRQPKEVESLDAYLAARSRGLPDEVLPERADEAAKEAGGYPIVAEKKTRAYGRPKGNGAASSGDGAGT